MDPRRAQEIRKAQEIRDAIVQRSLNLYALACYAKLLQTCGVRHIQVARVLS